MSEDLVQLAITQGLHAYGYVVFTTSRRVKRCPHCGKFPGAGFGDGVTKGLPDLVVTRTNWEGVLFGIEVKGPKTKVLTEQRELLQRNMIAIARSWEEARDAVCAFEWNNGLEGPLSRHFTKKGAASG